jgi:hypothetical protein
LHQLSSRYIERDPFQSLGKKEQRMRSRLQARLGELKKEFAAGQTHSQEFEMRKSQPALTEVI